MCLNYSVNHVEQWDALNAVAVSGIYSSSLLYACKLTICNLKFCVAGILDITVAIEFCFAILF